MIGIGGYRWSLRGTKVRQPMQCVILLIAGALFSPISAFGSEVSLSANPPSCSPEQSLRWRGGTPMSSTLEIIHKYHIISAQISAWEKPF
ncbi:hypothetical protein [Pseudomonas aeruginosa]|uniref:hypothetical protein n=1 Tax=Pseudomonas aeruginosa TaxID=287 RepID=UPI001F162256|nr:hypothetical protein [Pseudomonas aeruginosa]